MTDDPTPDDDQVLSAFVRTAVLQLENGFALAKRDSPEAFAKLLKLVRRGARTRLELTVEPTGVLVRCHLIGGDGGPVAQVFEMTGDAVNITLQ